MKPLGEDHVWLSSEVRPPRGCDADHDKSVLQVVRDALAAGEVAFASYASRFSLNYYTRPRLVALLLRRFLSTACCSIVMLTDERRELHEALDLTQVPLLHPGLCRLAADGPR